MRDDSAYGLWMLKAADDSGGLLGGIGVIRIGLGVFLGCFPLVTLALARPLQASPASV